MTHGASEPTFVEIYSALADAVREEALARGAETPYLRDPRLAHVSVDAVPRETLLGIEDDEQFVVNCYLVLLDRAPTAPAVADRVSRLRAGALGREEMVGNLLDSLEFARLGRRVRFTEAADG